MAAVIALWQTLLRNTHGSTAVRLARSMACVHIGTFQIFTKKDVERVNDPKGGPRKIERLHYGPWLTAHELGPKDRLEGFDRHEKIFACRQPAVLTGLNDAVRSFILMSYEHRV
jgi:hypothetical protein